MDDLVSRLENIINQVTKYVYILEEYDCYEGYSDIKGCYFTPEKVYSDAEKLIEYLSFYLKDVEKLGNGDFIESKDVNNKTVKIHKFLVE